VEKAMRALALGCIVLALGAGCGSSSSISDSTPDGSPRTGPTQVNLKITTAGNGLVRGAGADCRGSCTAPYVSGTQVHLVAVPDSGASFVAWSGACSGAGGCDLTLDADREVSATFAATPPPQGQHRLTVIVQGKGRVTSSPAGLDCDSSACSADFPSDTSVSLSAIAGSGFSFSGWGTGCSGDGGCSLVLSSDATVYANFLAQAPAQVQLSASVTGPGTITGGGLDCGESTSKCVVTVAGGSTATLTASAAGGARFGGWGGGCSGTSATCELTLRSDVRVTAEFRSEVLALAPNDGTNVPRITLNSTRVFWSRFVNGSFSIWSIPKNGGDAVRVAAGSAGALVADEAYLYWTDGSSIYSTPVGGGQVALLFTASSVGRLALDEVGALYWTGAGGNDGGVFRMQDRVATLLAKGENPAGAVAVDATHLYFTAWDGRGFLRRVRRGGGAVEQVLSCGSGCYPQAVRVDPQYIYFRSWKTPCDSASGQVQAVSKADFTVRSLSDGNGTNNCAYDLEVDVNASVVYWNWTSGTAPYGIFRANASGNGFATIDSGNDFTWPTVRVDDVAVYYWRAGAIIRRLK
jgi:List-Bact-rpt repeat protein